MCIYVVSPQPPNPPIPNPPIPQYPAPQFPLCHIISVISCRLRHASLSATNMLAGMDLDKVEPQRPVSPPASPPPAYKPSVYCEIVIPGIHTSDRPVLAKSRSEDQLNCMYLCVYVCAFMYICGRHR